MSNNKKYDSPIHSRRKFLQSASLAISTCLAAPIGAHTEIKSTKPNLVFIIVDDMQRYMFNCLPEGKGKNLTPNIDRLAREGTLMMGQHVTSPVCTPSRYCCLTGRYASRTRNSRFLKSTERAGQTVITWNTHILPDDPTLPKMLRTAGYTTGMVGKNHVIECAEYKKVPYTADPKKPEIATQLRRNSEKVKESIRKTGFDFAASIYYNNPDGNGPRTLAVHNLDWITQGAIEFLDQSKDKPFFLYFATTVPHGPMEKKRSWGADPRITADGFLDKAPNVMPPRESLSQRLKEAGKQTGWKENLLWLDDAVGALLTKMEEDGTLDNTTIVFFTDHGQAAKGTVYQGGVTDPSIIWRKGGFPCGSVSESLVSNIDFAPTLLELAGAQAPAKQFDGKSFLPILNGEKKEIHDSLFFELGYVRGVRMGQWKYIALRYPQYAKDITLEERKKTLERYNTQQKLHNKPIQNTDPTKPFSHISLIAGGAGAEHASTGKLPGYYDADQLYNLQDDPGEEKNLAADPKHAETLKEMKTEMRKYIKALPGTFDV